jgi:hypothetical protein
MIGTAASAIWPCCIANVTAASRAGPAAEHCDALAVFAQARQHAARLQLRSLMLPPIVEVESAIKARDREKFAVAFDKATAACNTCHVGANRGFVVIQRPATSAFPNQSFAPKRK